MPKKNGYLIRKDNGFVRYSGHPVTIEDLYRAKTKASEHRLMFTVFNRTKRKINPKDFNNEND